MDRTHHMPDLHGELIDRLKKRDYAQVLHFTPEERAEIFWDNGSRSFLAYVWGVIEIHGGNHELVFSSERDGAGFLEQPPKHIRVNMIYNYKILKN